MLDGILSIGGKPGLYKMVSQTKNGLIVESLIDKKRFPAFSSAKISALEDIAIFTEDEDVPLENVLKLIFEKEEGKQCIDPKSSNDELKNYLSAVLPDYDRDRVYVSDIKKILSWYNQLQSLELLNFEEDDKEKNKEDSAEDKTESTEKADVKETKTTVPKKTTAKTQQKAKAKSAPAMKTTQIPMKKGNR